ncbi:MAG: efflux RND transporter periplasmic adaptor subunit [Saprospiraceae bacterium]
MRFIPLCLLILLGCQNEKPQELQLQVNSDDPIQILENQIQRNLSTLPITHLPNHPLINLKNEKASLKDLVLDEILILRIPFVSCQVCRENELALLKQTFPSRTHKTAIVISAERNRDFFLFNRINRIEQPLFKFPTKESFAEWDKFGKPYALLLDKDLKIITVHFPLLEFPQLSEIFYKNIATRFQNNPWNFQESLKEEVTLEGMVVKSAKFWKETYGRGTVLDKNIQQITAPTSGYLKTWNFQKGQTIKKGDLLGTLILESLDSKLLQLQLNLKRSKGALEKRLIQLGYHLADSADIPPKIWEAAQLNSGYSESVAQIKQLNEEINNTKIWSPSKGKLKKTLIETGQRVQIGQPIAELTINQEKYLQFYLLKYQTEKIAIGDLLQITHLSNLKGEVSQISTEVEEDGTILVKAKLPPNQLLDGEKVNFKILSDPISGISIPRESIIQKNGKFSVYLFNQRPILKEILINDSNEDFVLVQSGLSIGDTIIKNPNGYLNHYQKINLAF